MFKTFWFLSTEVIPTMVRGVFFVGGCLKTLAFEWIPAVVSGFGRFTGVALQMVGTAISPVISGLGRLTLAMKTLYLQGMQRLMTSFPKLGLAIKALMVTGGILALASAAYMIYQNWDRLKEFFSNIWNGISEKWSAFTEKSSELWGELQKKVAPEKSDRTQNNNFTININGAKNDNAESLADKVMRGISSFGKTFLYDEVPEVL